MRNENHFKRAFAKCGKVVSGERNSFTLQPLILALIIAPKQVGSDFLPTTMKRGYEYRKFEHFFCLTHFISLLFHMLRQTLSPYVWIHVR